MRSNRLIGAVSLTLVLLAALSWLLPEIRLDTWFADLVVVVTDTGSAGRVPFVAVVGIGLVTVGGRRHWAGRAGLLAVIFLLVLGSTAAVNEYLLKPALASPRPDIVALTESGALGTAFPDAETLYAVGAKDDRRAVLDALLPGVDDPALSEQVQERWILETGWSFPSGHSQGAAMLAVVVGVSALTAGGWRRWLLYGFCAWAGAVALSRVLLQVHRPIDVVAGAALGGLWAWLVLGIFDRFAPEPEDRSPLLR